MRGSDLREAKRRYEVVVIDCPPTLGLLTVNALCAADRALLSTEAEYFSLQGVEQALEVISLARENLNPELAVLGIVLNIANMRTKHARQTLETLREHFGFDLAVVADGVGDLCGRTRGAPGSDGRPGLSDDGCRAHVTVGGEVAAEGTETRVWAGADPDNPGKIKAKPIPQAVIDRFNEAADRHDVETLLRIRPFIGNHYPLTVLAEADDFLPGDRPWLLVSAWPMPTLTGKGWHLVGHPPFMMRPVGGEAPPVPPSLRIAEVVDDAGLSDYAGVARDGYPVDPRTTVGMVFVNGRRGLAGA